MQNNHIMLRELRDEDGFHDFNLWPRHIKEKLLTPHKNNELRFYIWHFLWANGMYPHKATYYTLWHGNYLQAVHNSMRWLEVKALYNPEYFKDYQTFDMTAKRVVGGDAGYPVDFI